MYNIQLFGLQISEKKRNFACIIHTDFLEFVAAKFNQNLAFVQLFISCWSLEIRINVIYIKF